MTTTQKWQDEDKMPFGEHKGKRLGDVPDSYLFWLSDQNWVARQYPGLHLYVEAFVTVVAKENRR